ncbi:hypothetical protein FF098_009230 [Parvularcula flava]|uniref:Uncharacterized protein n=1 Tax=Aquisalinus luteolus TaxID=1566827 RepID=A0A8J3A3I1_9PROT|nr:hypothetical protein [Aquisalinus luteolus]NHK28083.1 hypothetical protein [Aquisalinus luteolus]GGH97406.1 hypothetical protein GCM10011355_18570 [Aquisalinus luteolus]
MKLKALQIVGIGAVIIFGAQLVLTLTEKKEDPMRFAIDTAEVLAASEPEPAPVLTYEPPQPLRRIVYSEIDFAARDLTEAEDAYYCAGIIMLGAANEAGRVSDSDQQHINMLSDWGNELTSAKGIDRDTAMVVRQQRLLQAQYDLEDNITQIDVDTCREMARQAAP